MPSLSSSSAASGGRCAWVWLHRQVRLADADPMQDSYDADVVVKLMAPPGVSNAFISRALALFPDADEVGCRIEGADASGRILFAFTQPQAHGEAHVFVSRPVTTSSDNTKAKAEAFVLPAFPEETLGLALSPAAPTGVLFDHGAKSGDGYFVAQIQSVASSSTASVARVLWFSSDEDHWDVTELPGEERWRAFDAHRIVSHDRVVHGDAARLVFVDQRRRGILLFNPRHLTATRFIELPEGGGGEAIEDGHASVDSSEGRLVYVLFDEVPEGVLVRVWCLSEDERGWTSHCHRTADDEDFGCDARVWPLQGAPRLGSLDPQKMTRILIGDVGGVAAFSLEVTPTEMLLRRVSYSSLDSVVWTLPDSPNRSWKETVNSVLQDGKQAGILALGAVQKGRKYVDSVPGAVLFVGGTLGLPHTAVALTAANAMTTINNSVTISENISGWVWQNRPGRPEAFYKVVNSEEEAEHALQEWRLLGEPINRMVDPAPGLPQAEWDAIKAYLRRRGGASLVHHCEWELVPHAPK